MILEGRVETVLVGETEGSLVTTPKPSVEFTSKGPLGEKHGGFTKRFDVRDRERLGDMTLPKGDPVYNWRQWSAVSLEELAETASDLDVKEPIDGSLLGANLVISGIPRFTTLPMGTTFHFPSGAILLVQLYNIPCIHPGNAIAKVHEEVSASAFVNAAKGRRGLVGLVYKAGIINQGDQFEAHVYQAPPYEFNLQ